MHSPDNIQYALETTRVLLEPDRRIDTFGDTRFEFLLLSELMFEAPERRRKKFVVDDGFVRERLRKHPSLI